MTLIWKHFHIISPSRQLVDLEHNSHSLLLHSFHILITHFPWRLQTRRGFEEGRWADSTTLFLFWAKIVADWREIAVPQGPITDLVWGRGLQDGGVRDERLKSWSKSLNRKSLERLIVFRQHGILGDTFCTNMLEMFYPCAIHGSIIQYEVKFVSSLALFMGRNVALHHLLTNGSSAVNGCRQNHHSKNHSKVIF